MVMLVNFGNYNKKYKYMLLVAIFSFLSYFINSGSLSQLLSPLKSKDINTDNLYIHPYIIDILNYLGIIIISYILYKKNEKKSLKKEINVNNYMQGRTSKIKLITNDMNEDINLNISFIKLIFTLSIWIAIDHIAKIIESIMIFDFWNFELLFLCLITSKILKTEVFSHQKLGIIINSVSCIIIGLIRFILIANHYDKDGINVDNKDDINTHFFCVKYLWFIPISIIIYFIIVSTTSYIFTELKFYMDLEFISKMKFLMLYGTIGFVLTTISCIIETATKCVGGNKDFFCKINIFYVDDNNVPTGQYDSYVENFLIFFGDFFELPATDIILQIILFLLGILFFYFSLYYEAFVIQSLTPAHFIFSNIVFLFCNELKELISIIIIKNQSSNDNSGINTKEFPYQLKISILNILAYIFTLIGFLIYLEMIVLNFCNLNTNLCLNINNTSIKDTIENDITESIINDEDNQPNSSSMENKEDLVINQDE